jgi:hypothetical protein
MSRYSLIHLIFNSVSTGSRGLSKNGDHFICIVSRRISNSLIPTYATLEKLSEEELVSVANSLGVAGY